MRSSPIGLDPISPTLCSENYGSCQPTTKENQREGLLYCPPLIALRAIWMEASGKGFVAHKRGAHLLYLYLFFDWLTRALSYNARSSYVLRQHKGDDRSALHGKEGPFLDVCVRGCVCVCECVFLTSYACYRDGLPTLSATSSSRRPKTSR